MNDAGYPSSPPPPPQRPPAGQPAACVTVIPPPRRRSFIPERWSVRCLVVLWRIVRQILFRCSPLWCNRLRVGLLNLFGARVARTAFVHPRVRIDRPWNLRVGPASTLQHGVIIESMGLVTIGRRTHISQYAYLCSGSHDYRRQDMQVITRPIHVGDGVWLASDVFIGPGVTVGDRVIVGARSTVFRDLPPNVIAAGNPARPLRPRPPDRQPPGAHAAAT
jgi:putative colanic acid biosynthesis acetyltransferase WcaF